ncbi:hypothetical protein [Legionella sp. km772]|uniref:hypothetical protein n=1 Tax=Legionella sp. km772 TaxID=2498111 RepID=UPI000F8C3247|nr:hypothetical protein [Legionella sp. km772]RUR12795.1 hypothetical protein ELY15_03935 [Legionella sp. km772]
MVILFPSYIRRIALKNTFFSSKNPRLYHFTIDNDTINIALLSGYLAQNVLRDLVHDFHVSYGSIRYAVKSDKLAVVNDLMSENAHLKFGSEHLTQAAAQNNMPIFDRIAETGVAPEGKRIHTLAQTNPELKTRLASLLESSMTAPSAGAGSAPRP